MAPADAAIAQALRARGLRVSAARRLVVAALLAADRPVSASDIAGGLGGRLPASDVASVYRNLDTLEHAGLARHLHLHRGPSLYELSGRPRRAYLACERCGSIHAADLDALAALIGEIRARLGFDPRFGEFAMGGVCAACRARVT
jgi:Fur family ferric uptake transcriptional regulator